MKIFYCFLLDICSVRLMIHLTLFLSKVQGVDQNSLVVDGNPVDPAPVVENALFTTDSFVITTNI